MSKKDIALEGEISQVGLVNSTYGFFLFFLLLCGLVCLDSKPSGNKLPTVGNSELLERSL
jgi:hypothetical protein